MIFLFQRKATLHQSINAIIRPELLGQVLSHSHAHWDLATKAIWPAPKPESCWRFVFGFFTWNIPTDFTYEAPPPTHSAQTCLLTDTLPDTQLELSSVLAFTTVIYIQVFLLQLVGAQLLLVELNSALQLAQIGFNILYIKTHTTEIGCKYFQVTVEITNYTTED